MSVWTPVGKTIREVVERTSKGEMEYDETPMIEALEEREAALRAAWEEEARALRKEAAEAKWDLVI